ncbi:MAG: 50S ribosomal protein L22 [Deltaproteobacteria bacterium]|nr:50S ribosomal protein L22 [Deltaproteobacteria bacterium]
MEFKARIKNLRVSPIKLRQVVDLARGKQVQRAIDSLRFEKRANAKDIQKLIESAVNNASQSRGVNLDSLYVKQIFVDQGPTYKRFMTRARGGASRILKRTSHVTVILDEKV